MSISGSLFGLAYGDAMGAPTEFMKMPALHKVYGKELPRLLPAANEDGTVHVTDDTQMALYLGNAVATAAETGHLTATHVGNCVTGHFITWHKDPKNDGSRAPGGACLSAAARMAKGKPWWLATNPDSKGCGANMRVTPVGLCTWLTREQRSGIAQLQAATTHWHPTALAAADVTQEVVHLLLRGADPSELPALLLDYVNVQRKVDPREWIGDIIDHRGHSVDKIGAVQWANRGWMEVRELLQIVRRTHSLRLRVDRKADPCKLTGEGWVAEEALATALHCFLMFPDDGAAAIGRAAISSGDSDSLAAITGAFAGAHLGLRGFPTAWRHQIEYADELQALAIRLS